MTTDYHALTQTPAPEKLRADLYDLAIDLIAPGLDPAKTVLFQRSAVLEHSEPVWIFDCLTTMPCIL